MFGQTKKTDKRRLHTEFGNQDIFKSIKMILILIFSLYPDVDILLLPQPPRGLAPFLTEHFQRLIG